MQLQAVVGAGAAGLAAARELLREGHQVTVFEQSSAIGGVWVYDEETEDDPLGQRADRKAVHGSMYQTLRTNLPREVMGFADFPFVPEVMQGFCKDERRFPGHEEVLRYLQAYAAHFNLLQHVRLNTGVQRAEPVTTSSGKKAWRVTTAAQPALENGASQGAKEQSAARNSTARHSHTSSNGSTPDSSSSDACDSNTATYDALMVCNGHYAVPRVPPIEGIDSFGGRCEHSHNYRRPEGYAGLRVFVKRCPGEDIARDVAALAKEVIMSANTWRNQELASQRGPFGAHNNMFRRGWPTKFCTDGSVKFEDGSMLEDVDVVMFCTGYHYSAPFLDESIVDTDNSHVNPLYRHLIHPHFRGSLSFIGIPLKIVPFPQFELQSKLIARVLSGAVQLPRNEEMQQWMDQQFRYFRETGQPDRHIHMLGGYQWEYNDWLADQCGSDVSRTPQWRLQLYNDACELRGKYEPDVYRDRWENPESLRQAHVAFEKHNLLPADALPAQ